MKKLMVMSLASVALVASAADISKQVKADFADYGSRAFVHYAVPAMSENQRLPDAYPADGLANAPVKIFAARGEYEPGAFNVWATRDLGKVKFEIGEFKKVEKVGGGGEKNGEKVGGGGEKVFPKENLDLCLVKCWFQNLNAWFSYFADTGDFKLCPELLLHDEDLIRTDVKQKANYARIEVGSKNEEGGSGEPRYVWKWINPPRYMDAFKPMAPGFQDAAELQPVALPKNEFRNFFLTVHTTKDTVPGTYRGEIVLKKGQETRDKRQEGQSQILGTIPVEIVVAPYELPRPKCYLNPTRDFWVSMMTHYDNMRALIAWNGGDAKLAKKQIAAILRDEAAHGENMHCAGGATPDTLHVLDESLKAGMRPDTFLVSFLPWGPSHEAREAMGRRISAAMDRRYGHRNLYVGYGDEPGLGDDGVGGFFHEYYNFIREFEPSGWKFTLSGETCCYRKFAYGLHLFNMAAPPTDDSAQLRMWKSQPGVRHSWYANQHVGPENPALNRRQNGLAPWLSGFDTLNNYAQHLGPYNDDCEDMLYRPMVYAYGTANGVIDTIQWEGFREGVDDMRYASLLSDLAYKAMAHKDIDVQLLGRKVFQYFALIDRSNADLDTCRAEMRRYIDRLLAYVKPDPVEPIAVPAKKPAESDALFAAEANPLEAEIAKKNPKTYGQSVKSLIGVYQGHMRYNELVDRLEKAGNLYEAAVKADAALDYDRAAALRLKFLKTSKGGDPSPRASAAWALVGTHPEIFDDPEFKACLEPVGGKTNNWLGGIWGQWSRLNVEASATARQRKLWIRTYRFAAARADAVGLSVCGLAQGAVDQGLKVFAAERDWKSMGELAARWLSKKDLKPKDRYPYELIREVFCGGRGPDAGRVAAFDKAHREGLPFAVRKAAINKAGALGSEACDEKLVRGLSAYLKGLYKPEPKLQYVVKFVDRDLSGVSDWQGLDVEEVRYNRKYGAPTEMFATDVVTGGRNVQGGRDAKASSSMRIVANAWGIHFLVTAYNDPEKVKNVKAHRDFSGNFEAYLAPGKNKPYVCLMTDDGESRWRIFNTAYNAIGQQAIDANDPDRVRSMTAATDDCFRSMLSLSWENFVADIPKNGSVWDFENLRWGSGEGSWNGLKVIHGRSSWGELVFELDDAARAKILRRVEEGAYYRFKKEVTKTQWIDRYEGCVRHWRDPYIGDPAFYEARLKVPVNELLEAGKVLAENPSDATILRLEANGTLMKWHNVFFETDRARTRWLEREAIR